MIQPINHSRICERMRNTKEPTLCHIKNDNFQLIHHSGIVRRNKILRQMTYHMKTSLKSKITKLFFHKGQMTLVKQVFVDFSPKFQATDSLNYSKLFMSSLLNISRWFLLTHAFTSVTQTDTCFHVFQRGVFTKAWSDSGVKSPST